MPHVRKILIFLGVLGGFALLWSFSPLLSIILIAVGTPLYAIFSIRQEEKNALSYGKKFHWNNFHLLYPYWWRVLTHEENECRFVSRHQELILKQVPPETSLSQIITEFHLEFDENLYEVHEVTSLEKDFFSHSLLQEEFIQGWHTQGTATEKFSQRVYANIFLLHFKSHCFYAYQKSGVLLGGIEGFYFERMIKKLKWIFKTTE